MLADGLAISDFYEGESVSPYDFGLKLDIKCCVGVTLLMNEERWVFFGPG